MAIARDMAARHNLEIRGFETAGLHRHTVRQIDAALDQVLGHYPMPLRGIEIAPLDGRPFRAENRGPGAGSGPVEPWIVLNSAAAADPLPPAGPATAAPQPRTGADREPPMYATVVRALGGVLDISGGGRARAEAQRALITEYLRVSGSKGDTLARVVSGYRSWRGELSESCFRCGVFAPEAALAEAFATVVSDEQAAGPPHKILHRLLVTMAKTADSGA